MLRTSTLTILIGVTLAILTACSQVSSYTPQTRSYYVAAEQVEWDYAPSGKDLMTGEAIYKQVWGEQTRYDKVRYIEYTDETFTTKKEQPQWLGINGPILRAVEGDTLEVHFLNRGEKPYSMHPHGVLYDLDNEGASHGQQQTDGHQHDPSLALKTGKGAQVAPGESFTYHWKASEKSAPSAQEGGSKVWLYHSHVDAVSDIYEGLFGPIIITSADHAKADATPDDVDKEFVTTYFIFNESEDGMSEEEVEGHLKHAINGTIFSNLQGLEMNQDDRVRWHLIGLGTEVDLHTAHWHGEVVKESGVYTDVIELLPASMKSVDMIAENPGTWMYHCHVADHITAGMMSTYTIHQKTL
ncbi:MAG: multicopper oxidase domain-containing protein [bacterium]|nr:multicopper oxidase domain-containing protein [bacterium]